ncbi:MAG: DUF2993 domain-containing protein [Abditibacteriota bacterium]|nr:DUF2993 domain-containing protein [Abditibacteriota bacterium]
MKTTRVFVALLLTAVLCAVSLTGCDPVRSRIEHEIVKAVSERFAPADSYKCRISGKVTDWLKGKVSRVELTGVNVRYDDTTYSKLNISVTNVVYNPVKKRITSCDTGSFTAMISEKEVNRMAAGRITALDTADISIRKDSLIISGKKKVLGVTIKAEAEGNVGVKRGCELWFDTRRIDVSGMSLKLPEWTKERISRMVNPVYTLDNSANELFLTGAACSPGAITVTGRISPDGLMASQ